jgi:hypothetical protein
MANSTAMCTSFKGELLTGTHNFTPTTGNTFKAALYFASGSLGAGTTAYSTTNEVTNTSGTGYTAGGVTVANANAPATSGTTAYWTPSGDFAWTALTVTTAFDAVLIYNSSASNKAISVHNFGSQTVTAGNFTLTMPASNASTGLLRIA